MIGIIDPESGNLASVRDSCARLGRRCKTLKYPELAGVEQLLLPGQGRFGAVMRCLRERGWDEALRDWLARDKPFFGICVGLQALFEESEEDPGATGLGILPGKAVRLKSPKRPMMGWAAVHWTQAGWPEGSAYFVNGYVVEDSEYAIAHADYGARFCAAVARGALFAAQFHPEKSGVWGKELMNRCLVS